MTQTKKNIPIKPNDSVFSGSAKQQLALLTLLDTSEGVNHGEKPFIFLPKSVVDSYFCEAENKI